MYAGTLTAVLAAPSLEVPINSLEELLAASLDDRVAPALLAGSSLEALFKVEGTAVITAVIATGIAAVIVAVSDAVFV